jgi:hypothetical protein
MSRLVWKLEEAAIPNRDVDDVAAVAAAIPGQQRSEGSNPAAADEATARNGAAPELGDHGDDREGRDEEQQIGGDALGHADREGENDRDHRGRKQRGRDRPPEPGQRHPTPGDERPDPHEEDQEDRQRGRVAVEPGSGER